MVGWQRVARLEPTSLSPNQAKSYHPNMSCRSGPTSLFLTHPPRLQAGRPCLKSWIALLTILTSIQLCSCALHTRTITSEPAGALIYAGPAPDALRTTNSFTPWVAKDAEWRPWCFAAAKPGYSLSPVQCLPGGRSDQYLTLTLVNLQSAGASNQLVEQTTPHGYSPADGYLQGSQQPVQAAVGPQTPASPNLGSLLRGFFTGISSPRLGGWSGAVGRGGQAALGEPPPTGGL